MQPPSRCSPNLPYAADNGGTPNYGTDIEFATLAGSKYALAGSYKNGMQTPSQSKIVSTYDCGVTQGDVQVFIQADEPGRTFVGYASDTFGDGTSTCYQEAQALGFDVLKPNGTGKNGTFIADVTDPLNPRTVGFVEVAQGSHNQSIHPSGNYLYDSNSDLITSVAPAIEVFDISTPGAPRAVGELDLPPRPGLGTESHDITFSDDGTRAYSAALSQGVIIDTRNPAEPAIVSSFLDPAINVWHQMDPFTMTDASGREREFVIAEDEFAGAVGTGQCPNGGVHVYETTGAMERAPEKVGYWNIDTIDNTDAVDGRCTAHVFDIHEDEQVMTISYYNGGVHVVDLSGLTGISLAEDLPQRRLPPLQQRHRARHGHLQVHRRGPGVPAPGHLDVAGRGHGVLRQAAEGRRDARERARLPAAVGDARLCTRRGPGSESRGRGRVACAAWTAGPPSP